MTRPASFEAASLISGIAGFGAFGGSAPWSTYVGREPMSPANVITCYDTGGSTGSLKDIRNPSVLVRVRSEEYEAGWAKADDILRAFYSIVGSPTADANYFSWTPTTDILFIGRDEQDRFLFTVNFNLIAQTGL